MPKLNWELVSYNLAEAREQLEQIEALIEVKKPPSEEAFQVMLEHAIHHLAFAWNIRKVSATKYSKMSDADFNKWSSFPVEIEAFSTNTQSDEN